MLRCREDIINFPRRGRDAVAVASSTVFFRGRVRFYIPNNYRGRPHDSRIKSIRANIQLFRHTIDDAHEATNS